MTKEEALLDGLDDAQRSAVTALSGPVRIIAGAGAGKTRTITRRIAYACATGAWDASRALAVTFSRDAARQLRTRLSALGIPDVRARTFHSAALGQLHRVWNSVCADPFPTIEATSPRFLAQALDTVLGEARAHATDPRDARDINDEISRAKVSLIAPADYENACHATGHQPPAGLEASQFSALYATYDKIKGAAGIMDFNDVILLDCHILERFETAARRIRSRIGVLTVDEYQDVSPLQHRLLTLWLGPSREICVVGDSAQTIYSFAGATNYYLRDFTREFAPVRHDITLERDYRSTGRIVHYANRILAASPVSDRYLTLTSAREDGDAIRPAHYATDADEAAAIARAIRRLIEHGTRPRDIGILARTNAQLDPIRAALTELDIPVRSRHQPEVIDADDIEAAATPPPDDDSDEEEREHGEDEAKKDAAPAKAGSAGNAAEAGDTGNAAGGVGGGEGTDGTGALAGTAAGPGTEGIGGIADTAEELMRRAEAGAVTLSTIHSAKGLEWDHVFVAGCSDGLIPYGAPRQGEEREEERRLMYVAATRAMSHLYVSYALRPSEDFRGAPRVLSPFLRDR